MNPTDAYRKEQRKRELKKNKKERKRVREIGAYVKNPELLKEEVREDGPWVPDHGRDMIPRPSMYVHLMPIWNAHRSRRWRR
jgi:hypothetical protein